MQTMYGHVFFVDCGSVRMGLFMICLLNIIIAFIAVFSTATQGWWLFWTKFGFSVIFGIVGFYSVYKLNRFKMRIYLCWIIFDLCVDIVAAIYETTFYDEICTQQHGNNTTQFKYCINKTSKAITIGDIFCSCNTKI